MSKTDNFEILEALYREAQEKLRAMLPILASELDVPVGDVSVSCMVHSSHDTGYLHGPCVCESFSYVGVAPKSISIAVKELRQKVIDDAFAKSEADKEAPDANA